MCLIFLFLLAACTVAALALLVGRLRVLRRTGMPPWHRLLNESVWTLIPLAVILVLWFRLA